MNKFEFNKISPLDPHPILLYSGSGSTELAGRISEHLQHPLGPTELSPHPNGETMIRLLEKNTYNVRSRDVFVIQSICRQREPDPYSGVNDMIMELLLWGNLMRLASAHNIVAVIPHFGYARQDRKNASRTPISARLMADLIQTAGFNRVLTMDLHAPQIQGFFDPSKCVLDHLNAGKLITDYFKSLKLAKPVILCPDVGNTKKVEKYVGAFPPEVEQAIIDKRRDPDTGEVKALRLIGDVKDKNVFMTDDIISTAGTMRNAIDFADKMGAKSFHIVATHGEFVGKAVQRLQHPKIKEIAVTDTIPLLPGIEKHLPIKVLSVSELFGEAIKRIHKGESISELLGAFG